MAVIKNEKTKSHFLRSLTVILHNNFEELDILSNDYTFIDNLEIGYNHMQDLQLVSYKDLHSTNAPCIDDEAYSYSKVRQINVNEI